MTAFDSLLSLCYLDVFLNFFCFHRYEAYKGKIKQVCEWGIRRIISHGQRIALCNCIQRFIRNDYSLLASRNELFRCLHSFFFVSFFLCPKTFKWKDDDKGNTEVKKKMCSRLQRFFYTFHEISLIPHYREIRLFVLLMNIKRIQQPSNRIDRISFICVSHILFFFNFSRLSLVSPHYSNLIVWNDLIGKSSWKVFPMNVFSTIFVFLQRKILLFSFILSSH